MFEAKTSAKTLQFPVADETPATRPAWLEEGQGLPVRPLFQPVSDEPTRPPSLTPERHAPAPPRPSELPPSPANAAAAPHAQQPAAAQQAPADRPEPPAAARPAPPEEPTAAPHAKPEAPEQHLDERVWSKLPPPPQLGSLIPGARSAPPPANDTNLVLLQQEREAFTQAALELSVARAATLSVLEGQLLDLAVEIASALIEREVEKDPELHGKLARAALSSLGDSDQVSLRTSPNAFDAICQSLGGAETTVRGVHVQVHADSTIPGLGCIVDSDNVRIDATVGERLRAVRRAFEDLRRKQAESSE